MFLPISTDAPLYHRPWGTVGVILANCVVFWVTGFGADTAGWVVQSGRLAPEEWFTAHFFHFDLLHLLGNMIFLWVFGMIVEGKLGFWKFLGLYLLMCPIIGCAAQVMIYGEVGQSGGGASCMVYALMAMSLVWAPKNEIEIIWIFFIGMMGRSIRQFEVTVFWFAMWYIGWDLFFAVSLDFAPSTPVFHCLGALVGFPVGVLLLRRGWVDCEGWDLSSVWRGVPHKNEGMEAFRYRGTPEALAKQADVENRRRRNPEREIQEVHDLVLNGKHTLAWSRYDELRRTFPSARLDEDSLRQLIDALRQREEWRAVVELLAEYIERFPNQATRARLMQAAVFVRQLNRPLAARRALEPLPVDQLTENQRQTVHDVRSLADRQIAEGVIEMQGLTPAL